jgi:hypothetical protein
MSEGSEKENQGIKINDRRRFDAGGNERAGGDSRSETAHSSAGEPLQGAANLGSSPDQTGSEYSSAKIEFGGFIMSLATQALMQLGEMPPPEGFDIEKDASAAKQTIDILGMLKEKTAGNLSAEEDKFFEEMLHQLRLSYLRVSHKSA